MNIEKLFSTKERVKIIKEIIYCEREFGVNEIARNLKISKGLVSKYFEILVKEGVSKRSGNKFYVLDNLKVRAIKIMLNLLKIDPKIFRKYKFVKSAGLYGSCTKGTNTKASDIDIWIKIHRSSEDKVMKLTSELRKNIENIKILLLDDKKIEMLKKDDPLFYHSLFFGSIIIFGKENEI
ncbi:MAG: nucleotidyltransferase domain-containing protein [Nanoarchaeota archaeon]